MIQLPNITKIIEQHGGGSYAAGMEQLRQACYGSGKHIRIENPGYMPLVIEHIGELRGMPLVSVAHYYTQEGDMMRDPDVVFAVLRPDEIETRPHYLAVSFRQDGGATARFDEAVLEIEGRVMTRMRMQREIEDFAKLWDRNIGQQGFVEAQASEAVQP